MKAINIFILAVIIFYSNISFSRSGREKNPIYEVGITYAALADAGIVHFGIDGAASYESEKAQIIGDVYKRQIILTVYSKKYPKVTLSSPTDTISLPMLTTVCM